MRRGVFGKVGYFDPNTYGLKGYSFIGPLLLFYNKLVLYGPVSGYIEQCYNNKEFRQSSLSPEEFIRAISDGKIIPIGFESFFDIGRRRQFRKPELGITSSFDKDLLKSNSILGRKVFRVPNNFKTEASPKAAKELIDNNQLLRDKISMLVTSENFPTKYYDFTKIKAPVPPGLKKALPDLSHSEIIPYLVIYDLLNNRYVMKKQGMAHLHIQFSDFINLYESIHGFDETYLISKVKDNDVKLSRSEISSLISEALRECCKKKSRERITYERIQTFRDYYREDFIGYIRSIILEVQTIPDHYRRAEEFKGLLNRKLEKIEGHADFSLVNLTGAVLSHLGLPDFSKLITLLLSGPEGSYRNKIYHELHSPINKKDRWAYEFIKKEEING